MAGDDCWHTRFWFDTCDLAGIGSNPTSLESYLTSLDTVRASAREFSWGDIQASVTQSAVDVYTLELNLLGMPRDERDELANKFIKDFLVKLRDE